MVTYKTPTQITYQLSGAAGGMVLDRDRLVFAHREEMILPANLTFGLRKLVESGPVALKYKP